MRTALEPMSRRGSDQGRGPSQKFTNSDPHCPQVSTRGALDQIARVGEVWPRFQAYPEKEQVPRRA